MGLNEQIARIKELMGLIIESDLSNISNSEKRYKFDMDLPEEIFELSNIFKKNGKLLYIVGGAVRDALLNKTPKDFDLVTDALPDEVENMLNESGIKTIPTGKSFGIINAIINNEEYEIATFRSEGEYSDSRRPDSVDFTTIDKDVSRRDLTINALYYDIENKEIIDFVGGVEDIKKGVVKTVGSAEDRFGEDKLRKLRAIRFAARFGSNLDKDTDEALLKDSNLDGISGERIRDEFIKGIKSAKNVIDFLEMVKKYGFFKYIFPKLDINEKFIKDDDYIIQLALLLKDNPADLVSKVLNTSKYTNDEVKAIKFLMEFKNLSPETAMKLKKLQRTTNLDDKTIRSYAKYVGMSQKLVDAFFKYNLSVNADDVMKEKGIKGGKELGDIISQMEKDNFEKLISESKHIFKHKKFLQMINEAKVPSNFGELIRSMPKELKELFFKQWHAKQSTKWHPEGNTLKHIIVVLKRAYHHYPNDPNMIMAALFHDLGKMDTYAINPKTNEPTAYGHEDRSTEYVDMFKDWIGSFDDVDIEEVKYIVKNHMKVKPRTWDVMRDSKKEPIMSNPAFNKLMGFTDKLDGGGTKIEKD